MLAERQWRAPFWRCDQLVGMGNVRQIMGGEDQRLRKAPVLGLVCIGVLLEFREILAVEIGRRDRLFHVGSGQLAFVLGARLGIDELQPFTFRQMDAAILSKSPRRQKQSSPETTLSPAWPPTLAAQL